MKAASRELEFEHAALLRDQIVDLRRDLLGDEEALPEWSDQAYGRSRRPLNRRKEPTSTEPTSTEPTSTEPASTEPASTEPMS